MSTKRRGRVATAPDARPRRLCVTAVLVVLVLASACGSSVSSSGSAPAFRTGQQRVDRMVLVDGDLPGYHLESTGAEVLADQMPPPRMPRAALLRRLVAANWVASDHSTLVGSAKADPAIFSDANLFKSAAVMHRIWMLEGARVPGIHRDDLAAPPGAPAGADYTYSTNGKRASYQLSWQEGSVLGLVIVEVPPRAHLSAGTLARIAATLGRAAKVESIRIAAAVNGSPATI